MNTHRHVAPAAGLRLAASLRSASTAEPTEAAGFRTASLILLVALGTTAIETAYAGRAGTLWGPTVFWLGQLLLYGAATYGVLRADVSELGRLALIVSLGMSTFILKVAYSPLHYTFPDEFQHWRSLSDVLRTHHLFEANPSLPVSPSFPGLEIVTHALMSLTGASSFAAGLLVTGVAHVLLVTAVFLAFRQLFSGPVSGLATIIFATEPHFEYFDSIFGYQTLALPLGAIVLLSILRLMTVQDGSEGTAWWVAGLLSGFALVVTHHVTALAILVLLLVMSAIAAARGQFRIVAFTAVYTLAAGAWIATIARGTFTYLGNPIIDSLRYIVPGTDGIGQTHGSPTPAPVTDRVVAYAAVATTLLLIVLGWRRVQRLHGAKVGELAFATAAISYPCVLFIRVFAGDSAELAGRLLTFALLPVAGITAPILAERWAAGRHRYRLPVIATVLLLASGGVVIGWPAWWERLPSSFRIASFERGVDQLNVAPAMWAREHLGANNHFGGDFIANSLMETYGNQVAIQDVSSLFYARRINRSNLQLIKGQSIGYLVVDRRMAQGLPATGGYFAINPFGTQQRRLMPAASLAKFDHTVGISRIYDNGTVRLYELGQQLRSS